jgi:hypothetical protein
MKRRTTTGRRVPFQMVELTGSLISKAAEPIHLGLGRCAPTGPHESASRNQTNATRSKTANRIGKSEAQMLLHFVVISLFEERHAFDALGPKDPDLAHQSVAETLGRAGIKSGKPQDLMWYLILDNRFVGCVKVFREERYARNWFRDLAEKEASTNFWAYWRDGYPLALVQGAKTTDANQFVKSIAICRVRGFSAQSAAENGWKNWISGNLTAIEIYQDKSSGGAETVGQLLTTTTSTAPADTNVTSGLVVLSGAQKEQFLDDLVVKGHINSASNRSTDDLQKDETATVRFSELTGFRCLI